MPRSCRLLFIAGMVACGVGQVKTQSGVDTVDRVPRGGARLYALHCASCHGDDGKGDGPRASRLNPPPSDLTTIAKNNSGVFPRATIEDVILNGGTWKGRGSKTMPTFGPMFRTRSNDTNPGITEGQLAIARVQNVVAYLETLQVKQ